MQVAMILAAGHGKRMHPLTLKTPKPLLSIGGKPIMEWHIERLAEYGIKRIVINHSILGEQIENYFGDGSPWGVEIVYSPETQALETGGGILKALPKIVDDPFIVVNGDVWCDFSFDKFTIDSNDLAQLVLVPNPDHNLDGDFSLEYGRVGSLGQGPNFTFSGIGIYRKKLFHNFPHSSFPLITALQKAINKNRVGGILYEGNWIDIGTPERLSIADDLIKSTKFAT